MTKTRKPSVFDFRPGDFVEVIPYDTTRRPKPSMAFQGYVVPDPSVGPVMRTVLNVKHLWSFVYVRRLRDDDHLNYHAEGWFPEQCRLLSRDCRDPHVGLGDNIVFGGMDA